MTEFTPVEQRIYNECHRCMPDIVAGVDTKGYPYGWALSETLEPLPHLLFEPVTMRTVTNAIHRVTGVSLDILRSDQRRKPATTYRALASMLILQCCPVRSVCDIGRFLNKDHTSILAADRRAKRFLGSDPDFAETYRLVCAELAVTP